MNSKRSEGSLRDVISVSCAEKRAMEACKQHKHRMSAIRSPAYNVRLSRCLKCGQVVVIRVSGTTGTAHLKGCGEE